MLQTVDKQARLWSVSPGWLCPEVLWRAIGCGSCLKAHGYCLFFPPCLCACPPELLECTWCQMWGELIFTYLSLFLSSLKRLWDFFLLSWGREEHTHIPSTHFWNFSELYLNTFSPVISVFSWCALLWSLVCPCGAAATTAESVSLEDVPTLRSWKVSLVVEISLETAVVCLYERKANLCCCDWLWFVVEVIIFCITYEGW